MESNLRPLTLGEILDRTAQLYRTNFLLFAGIAAVYSGFGLLLNLFILVPVTRMNVQPVPDGSQLLALFAATGVVLFLLFIVFGATVAATTRAVAWLHLSEPATIRSAYTSTLPRLGRYLWLKTITTFMIFLAAIAAGIVLGIPAGILGFLLSSSAAPGTIFIVLMVLLIYACIGVVTCWVALRYSLAIPASVMENLKARKAIRRSIELSKGSRGRIFVLWLLVGFIWIGLFSLANGFFLIYPLMHHQVLPIGFSVLQQILDAFVNTFVVPIPAIGATLFYYDQRIRKEGYDIEWMMQAAGLTVPAPAAEQPAAAVELPVLAEPLSGPELLVAVEPPDAVGATPNKPEQPIPTEPEAAHE
ncbi:MAG: glycerophosphoryl diester phosphodiesterase membrane domain-containing protein [Terracidiphilus sp.]